MTRRLTALSGFAFVPLFVVGWFTSGGTTPHYTAADQKWVQWARDNQDKGRISAFLMLLACFAFLHFMGAMRERVGRVAYTGALVGIVGMTMAFVTLAAASSDGSTVDPAVSKAVTTGDAGPFLVSAVGFAVLLLGVGRSKSFARWTSVVALIGGAAFLVTLLTVLTGTTDGSAFGYAFFPAILALVIWTAATSVAEARV